MKKSLRPGYCGHRFQSTSSLVGTYCLIAFRFSILSLSSRISISAIRMSGYETLILDNMMATAGIGLEDRFRLEKVLSKLSQCFGEKKWYALIVLPILLARLTLKRLTF